GKKPAALSLINEIAAVRYQKLAGLRMQILVEGPSKRNAARMMGRTRCNKIVVFDGSERHRGEVMDVLIERAGSFTLYADPVVASQKLVCSNQRAHLKGVAGQNEREVKT